MSKRLYPNERASLLNLTKESEDVLIAACLFIVGEFGA